MAYLAENFQVRSGIVEKAGKSLNQTYKDQFYTRLMGEINEVTLKQVQYFRETHSKDELVDKSLSDLIYYFVAKDEKKFDGESKNLKRSLNLNEQVYFAIAVRAYAESKNWPQVVQIMKMKNPPVPYSTMGEILCDAGNRELAQDAFRKVPNKDLRVELLIEH